MKYTLSSMVDTVNITRQMERNANLGILDFYLVEHEDGELGWAGTMDLHRVLEIGKTKIFEQDSCDTSKWIPVKPIPDLPASLEKTLKTPDLLKKTANMFMEWLLRHQALSKPGDDGFLGWGFQMDRELFVINDKALSTFTGPTFSLEQIVPWSSLKSLKNGFQAGGRDLLLAQSGVKAWLAFLRIFVEVSFLMF